MAQHGNNFIKFIYRNSPWFLKTVLASYYGFSKSFQKYGKHYNEYYNYLTRSQWFTTDQLIEMQVKELKRIITYAGQNVPYYIDVFDKLKLSPDDINSIEDLRKLPILTKEEVRANCERLKSKCYKKKDSVISHTSGSTGKALELTLSKESYKKEQALIWFHRSLGGIKYKDKTATFAGHMVIDVCCKRPPFWVNNLYENQIIFSSYHLTEDNLKYYVEKLIRFQPKLIWGYPSSIYLIAAFLEKENITELQPKAIFLSSETLLDYQREKIEKAFNTKVFILYGNGEMVARIIECEKGGLHILHEYGIIEFLDKNDEPVDYGQIGRMICTGFINYAMPLIRYDIGDVAIPLNKTCECGRKHLLVEGMIGRLDDYVVTPEGRLLGCLGGTIFEDVKAVQEAQIIQKDRNTIILKIVKRLEYSEKDTQKLVSLVQNSVGNGMKIGFEFTDNIPRLPNGKFKFVISKVPLQNGGLQQPIQTGN